MLKEQLEGLPGVTITQPVQANGVFAILPEEITLELRDYCFFYVWNEKINEVRLMCSFDTTEEEIMGFGEKIRSLLKK